jgi:hypothetical protein
MTIWLKFSDGFVVFDLTGIAAGTVDNHTADIDALLGPGARKTLTTLCKQTGYGEDLPPAVVEFMAASGFEPDKDAYRDNGYVSASAFTRQTPSGRRASTGSGSGSGQRSDRL